MFLWRPSYNCCGVTTTHCQLAPIAYKLRGLLAPKLRMRISCVAHKLRACCPHAYIMARMLRLLRVSCAYQLADMLRLTPINPLSLNLSSFKHTRVGEKILFDGAPNPFPQNDNIF